MAKTRHKGAKQYQHGISTAVGYTRYMGFFFCIGIYLVADCRLWYTRYA